MTTVNALEAFRRANAARLAQAAPAADPGRLTDSERLLLRQFLAVMASQGWGAEDRAAYLAGVEAAIADSGQRAGLVDAWMAGTAGWGEGINERIRACLAIRKARAA